jgi:hypothetical protein
MGSGREHDVDVDDETPSTVPGENSFHQPPC